MKKGILLIALGHPNYLQMAINLAVSIHCNDELMNIALVTDRIVPDGFREFFDRIIMPPLHVYTNPSTERIEYIKAKLHLYELSPFEETIFLDVDQIGLKDKKLSKVFEDLQEVKLTFSNTGLSGYSQWVNIQEVRQLYGDVPFWNYHSEFVYFKKCREVEAFFKEAVRIYENNPYVTAITFSGGVMADELAFQTASIKTGMYPHREHWTPNFWYKVHPKLAHLYLYQLDNFYTYSIGGNSIASYVVDNYNNLAGFYFSKLGLQNPYKAQNKRSFMPERQKF